MEASDRELKETTSDMFKQAELHLPEGYAIDSHINTVKRGKQAEEINPEHTRKIRELIYKLKVKSEPELLRFFRLAIADSHKEEIKEKIKGTVLRHLVLEAAKGVSKSSLGRYVKNKADVDSKKAEPILDN